MINKMLAKLPYNRWNQRWGIFSTMVLTWPTGEVYLRRWRIIQTPLVGLYVHRIERPDHDVALHDHPWRATRYTSFWSFIVRGGYTESFATATELECNERSMLVHTAPTVRSFPNGAMHRIGYVQPNTWTVVLVGRRVSSWCFYDAGLGQRVDWRAYLLNQGREPNGGALIPDA